jgi:hypothetical protein
MDEATDPRYVTLLGATGATRVEQYEGQDHLVVPVVALVEGVVHAVNSPQPEFVSANEFTNLAAWNGRPIFAGHPTRNGVPVSGNTPEVLPESFGRVFNARLDGKRLLMEAWINTAKAKVGTAAGRVLERIKANLMNEVSVGVFVNANKREGVHNGKRYLAEWKGMIPDHLALLDDGQTGACSIAMGCGTPRIAMRIAENGELELADDTVQDEEGEDSDMTILQRFMEWFRANAAAHKAAGGKSKRHAEASDSESDTELKAACGCGGADHKPATSAVTGEENMERKERIAALAAHAHNPVKSLKMLEAATDEELGSLEQAAEAAKTSAAAATEAAAAATKADTDLKAAQARITVLEAPKSEEEFLKSAPKSLRDMLNAAKAQTEAEHTALVDSLKTAQASFNEDELKAMDVPQLQKIAGLLKVETPVADFSGKGLPRAASSAQGLEAFAAPDPWAKK